MVGGGNASTRKSGPPARTKPVPTARARSALTPPQPPAPAAPPKDKPRKPKLVRDSFTMPEAEYQALAEIKKACLKAGVAVKKSELLRIGVPLVRDMDAAGIKARLECLVQLRAGRPRKEER